MKRIKTRSKSYRELECAAEVQVLRGRLTRLDALAFVLEDKIERTRSEGAMLHESRSDSEGVAASSSTELGRRVSDLEIVM